MPFPLARVPFPPSRARRVRAGSLNLDDRGFETGFVFFRNRFLQNYLSERDSSIELSKGCDPGYPGARDIVGTFRLRSQPLPRNFSAQSPIRSPESAMLGAEAPPRHPSDRAGSRGDIIALSKPPCRPTDRSRNRRTAPSWARTSSPCIRTSRGPTPLPSWRMGLSTSGTAIAVWPAFGSGCSSSQTTATPNPPGLPSPEPVPASTAGLATSGGSP